MKSLSKRVFPLLAVPSLLVAGGLTVEIGNPDANPQAKQMKALLVARVLACHEPAKSNVTANAVTLNAGAIQRAPLLVIPLSPAGSYAVIGASQGTLVVEVTVTNPQYGSYESRLLVRLERGAIQWASLKRLGANQPSAQDVRVVTGAEARAANQL